MKKLLIALTILSSISVFSQTAQEYYNNGVIKVNSKDYKGSILDFDKAINADSKFIDAYYNRGTSKLFINDLKGALADFDKSIELKPDFVNAIKNRAVTKLKLNDFNASIKDLDIVINIDLKDASAYFMRGQAKLQSDDTEGGCGDLLKAKELGENRADKFINLYCKEKTNAKPEIKQIESLRIDWPDSEGWKVANEEDNAQEKMIELLRNNETFENWTEIGTMFVYKNIAAKLGIPIKMTMDQLFENAKKNCPSAKLTFIEKNDTTKYQWIIFKVECTSNNGTESQVWHIIQGTDELFSSFRAVKQNPLPADLEKKWVEFFKTARIVIQ